MASGRSDRPVGGPDIVLGANTCFAVKRWPEPERWLAVLGEELGLDQCQVTLDLFEPGLDPEHSTAAARAIARASSRAGITLHSTFTGLAAYSSNLLLDPDPLVRSAAERWFGRAIELTAEMGAAGTGGYLGAFSVSDSADPATRRRRLDGLTAAMVRLSQRASASGLSFLMFENMAVEREFGHRIEEAHELEERASTGPVPWVLCLDLGHPCALRTGTRSDDPVAWLSERWRSTPVLQIQQANRGGDFHWPFTPERNAEGLLDPRRVVRYLAGWPADEPVLLFLEVIHPAEHPDDGVLADLRQSVACWREAMAEAAAATPAPTASSGATAVGGGAESPSGGPESPSGSGGSG